MDDKTPVRTAGHRQGHSRQAVRVAAAYAGEMGMALAFRAIVGQFKMPRPLFYKRLMDQSNFKQTLKRPINGDLVEVLFAQPPCNLHLIERSVCFNQHFQDGHSAARAVKLCRFEHLSGLRIQIRLCHFYSEGVDCFLNGDDVTYRHPI